MQQPHALRGVSTRQCCGPLALESEPLATAPLQATADDADTTRWPPSRQTRPTLWETQSVFSHRASQVVLRMRADSSRRARYRAA